MRSDHDAPATLAIIAGGRARRLGGVAKGLLTLDGRTVLARLLDLRPRFAEVLLIANDPAPYAATGLRTVPDVVPDRGAPGGVHAALVHARTPWILAVAADMPFVSPAAVEVLLAARTTDLDALCFDRDGQLEPLLGAYRTSVAERWGRALAEAPSFTRLFERLSPRTLALPIDQLRTVDPSLRSLVNVNTPEEARREGLRLPDGTTAGQVS